MNADILIVDDEADIRNLIKGILEDEGYAIRTAGSAREAYAAVQSKKPDLIVLDIWLQGSDHDGLQILSAVKQQDPALPVIMISGHGTIETAVSSIKKGAYDFIEKPFKSDRLLLMIRRALETAQLMRENISLKRSVRKKPVTLLGTSAIADGLREMIAKAGPTNSRILLTGEAGAGKDIAARLLHDHSRRADKPYVVLNCATLRPEKFEAELFGSDKHGEISILEQAHGGTLVLDEIADMPLEAQAKMLRVMQDQRFQKPGAKGPVDLDIRVIATTNRDLEILIAGARFRQDLYYRLNVVPISIPPLRERVEDIPNFVTYFLEDLAENSGLPVRGFSPLALSAMQAYSWPGNVRQLRNVVEWVLIMYTHNTEIGMYEIDHLPPEIRGFNPDQSVAGKSYGMDLMMHPLREAREMFERDYLQVQVNRFGGNISKTAQFIGMERSALHRKLKSLQIATAKEDGDGSQVIELYKKHKQATQ